MVNGMDKRRAVIPYGRQSITEQDITGVVDVLNSDFLTTGPSVESFEKALANRVGAKHAIAVSNGTAALHLLYAALGLGSGDKIIVPSVTFLATASAAELLGAETVFADVDPDSGLVTADTLEQAFKRAPDARFVTAVHLNGQSCNMTQLATVCARHDTVLLEDAAHAIGTDSWSEVDETTQPVGACRESTGACFSFHPVKTIAMGEGGAVTCNDDDLAAKIRLLRSHSMSRTPPEGLDSPLIHDGKADPWVYFMDTPGYNYRVTDIQCALGASQLARLDEFVTERRRLVERYDEAFLSSAGRMKPIARISPEKTAWHLYPILCLGGADERRVLYHHLLNAGIRPQVHYIPLTQQPYYRNRLTTERFPGADSYYDRVISLPLFVGLTKDEQNYVIDAVKAFFRA